MTQLVTFQKVLASTTKDLAARTRKTSMSISMTQVTLATFQLIITSWLGSKLH